MKIICDEKGRVLGLGNWVDGFRPLNYRVLTLEEEVRRNGLAPVVKRMKRQGNWEKAAELLEKFNTK